MNIIVFPVYIIAPFMGFLWGMIKAESLDTSDLFLTYLVTLAPNGILFLAILIWGRRWKLNKKLNVLFFLIASAVIFYYCVLEPLKFSKLLP